MRKSATNLFRLLENLLDWSKVEQGLMPFNPMTVFLLPILNETLSVAIGLASNKGIDLTYKIPEDLEVFADWNMLKTVVRNLLSNAIKFTPKGGKVILSTEISGYKCIKICIKDNGIGMDKDLVNNLFKLDKSTGRKGTEGELSTGLGLILCKDFIKSHGGRIWVESIEGKGSSFYFTLPMKDVED
jgi:signal transduction histidine kinase